MKMHVLAGIGLVAVGCASHSAPTEQIASSVAAVRAAEEAGARDVPEAALQVKLAEEELMMAKQLMEDDDNARAESVAMRAYQDAELALAIAKEKAALRRVEQFSANTTGSGGEQTAPGQPPMTTAPQPGSTTSTP